MKTVLLCICVLGIGYKVNAQSSFYKNYEQVAVDHYYSTMCMAKSATDELYIFTGGGQPYTSELIKCDHDGNLVYQKKWESALAGDIISTKDGGVLMANYGKTLEIIKLDKNGSLIFSNHYSMGSGQYYLYSVGEFNGGDLFLQGTYSNGGVYLNYLLKINSQGDVKWGKTYANYPIWGFAIPCLDGGILSRMGNVSFKTDVNGNVEWSKSFDDLSYSYKPVETNDGFVFGRYGSIGRRDTCYLYKLDKKGNIQWVGQGFPANYINSVSIKPDGNFLIMANYFIKEKDFILRPTLIETDSTGKFIRQSIYFPEIGDSVSVEAKLSVLQKDGSFVFTGVQGNTNIPFFAKVIGAANYPCNESKLDSHFVAKKILNTPLALKASNVLFKKTSWSPLLNELNIRENIVCFLIDKSYGVAGIKSNEAISVFPNPFNSFTSVSNPLKGENCFFTISDISGKEVLRKKIETEPFYINAAELSSGFYFLTIFNEQNKTQPVKILVNH